ncbi:MAG: NUDIX domain-containing protein [Minisyncoccia bacterium]
MQIKSKLTNHSGQVFDYVYYENENPMENLEGKILKGVHGFCFCGGKLVVVYSDKKGYWTPPGGGIESGESYEEALIREIKEESNMRVISHQLIGHIDITEPNRIVRQTRSFCLVEPYGDFVTDPDGDINKIELIDPKDYKKYFDWGEIGDRLMEQAVDMFNKNKN